MKKIILIIAVLLICGCSFSSKDEYEGYEHYDLKGVEKIVFTINDNYNETEEYVLTLSKQEISEYSLYYKVGEDDYILLDKNTLASSEFFDDPRNSILYGDKLFIVPGMMSVYEYHLDKENTTKKDIKFNYTKIYEQGIDDEIEFWNINNLESGYMYIEAHPYHDSINMFLMKCSTEEYTCEIDKKL